MSGLAILRFAAFELHTGRSELRHHGDVVKLPPQPFKVLELLARRSGEVVTRAEIREHIWCGDTFVDFEQGLNFCIRQIREALGDSADTPRFIETLPRRGYRFLMPVRPDGDRQPERLTRLIVLPFRLLRPDPETDFLAFSLPDAMTGALGCLRSLVVRSSMTAARFAADADPKTIGSAADVDMIVTGTLLRAGDQIRVATQLTDTSTGTLLWSHSAQAAVGDLFHVQDELCSRIVSALSLPLTEREKQLLHSDVPANARAYEFFLRGNQLSYDTKQWSVARDLYLQSVQEDPNYAPAWARLGRIHHVMAKYVDTGREAGFGQAEEALRRALDINPDLTMAHKLLAQLDGDLGRARDAMVRLIARAHIADPELLAGLVSTCRYCGLLDASAAAHDRAVILDPKIKTSVGHTWFLQAAHEKVATIKVQEFPYIVPISLDALGRRDEALPILRELEQTMKTRVPGFVVAARALLEGNAAESLAAVKRVVASGFKDPEGLFYLTRHLAHMNDVDPALELFERVVAGGYFCYPAMADDPWLEPLRKQNAFTKVLKQAETQHREAAAEFARLEGDKVLGTHG
jgi:DNA-binding winged helix-turn-helix (wHTH) protein/tetratricopeptide (TPR) repeat protein